MKYRIGDFTSRPEYQDETFDVVSCVSVLEHMRPEQQLAGIKEMERATIPGGRLIITYDREEDLTDKFIRASGMTPTELAYFVKPHDLYDANDPDVIGICLVK